MGRRHKHRDMGVEIGESEYLAHVLRGLDAFLKFGQSEDPNYWREGLVSLHRSLKSRLSEIALAESADREGVPSSEISYLRQGSD